MLYFIQEIETTGGVTMNFGDKLKELRKEKGLSQKDLAEKLNVTQRTISYYENSTTAPSNAEIVTKIADALNVRLDELAADIGNTKIHKLIEKLKSDTEKNLIQWQVFENAWYVAIDDHGYHDTLFYKNIFKQQNFPQYANAILIPDQSYFYTFGSGGYFIAKFKKDDTVEFALFILVEEKIFTFLTNSTSTETLEDLYWSINNSNSAINNLIDDYLNKDFAKEEADRKEREAKQTSIGIPFDEEIPF